MAASSTTFRKGKSGNPHGRPKELGSVIELARKHTTEAVATLAEIMNNRKENARARAAAAEALLSRGWGRPAQPIGGADNLPPIRTLREMTDAELLARAQSGETGARASTKVSMHG